MSDVRPLASSSVPLPAHHDMTEESSAISEPASYASARQLFIMPAAAETISFAWRAVFFLSTRELAPVKTNASKKRGIMLQSTKESSSLLKKDSPCFFI